MSIFSRNDSNAEQAPGNPTLAPGAPSYGQHPAQVAQQAQAAAAGFVAQPTPEMRAEPSFAMPPAGFAPAAPAPAFSQPAPKPSYNRSENKWSQSLQKIVVAIESLENDDPNADGHVVLIGSNQSGSGVTTISQNVAWMLKGKVDVERVAVVGFISRQMGGGAGGVGVDLLNDPNVSDTIQSMAASMDFFNLNVYLPENPQDITAVVSRLNKLLKTLRSTFQWIVIDSPSFDDHPASFSLARGADAAVLIADSRSTQTNDVNDLVEELQQMDVNLLGLVLNHA